MRFVRLGTSTVVSVEHLVRLELVGDAIEGHLETGAIAVGRYSDRDSAAAAFELIVRAISPEPAPTKAAAAPKAVVPAVEMK